VINIFKLEQSGVRSLSRFTAHIVILAFLAFALGSCQKDEAQRMFDNGMQLWKEQKYDEAIQNFIALTKAFPEHDLVDDSLFWIANIYEHFVKNPDQAVRFYRSLNNMFEDSEYNISSMFGLARMRAMQGDEGKRRAIRILMKLQKSSSPPLEDDLWEQNQFQLAHLFFELKNFEQARAELKRLIFEHPESRNVPLAYFQIGKYFQEEGNLELAKMTFIEVDSKYKHKKEALSSALSLAAIYEESGELKEAIQIYESILNRLEKKEVFYQLANNRIKKLKSRVKKTKTG
jgi:TolA-binding protein